MAIVWSNDNFFAGICRKNLPQSSKKGNILSKKQVFFGAKISYNNIISNKLDEIALKSNFKATFLIRTPFLVRPTTYGPPNRNEGIWMDYIFLTNHVGALGGGVGRYVLIDLSMPVQGVHLWKETMNFESPLILVISILGLHMDVDQLKNYETP